MKTLYKAILIVSVFAFFTKAFDLSRPRVRESLLWAEIQTPTGEMSYKYLYCECELQIKPFLTTADSMGVITDLKIIYR